MDLAAGKEYVVDTGRPVTFEKQVSCNVKKVAGWKSTHSGDEGLVVALTGPGNINLQSRIQDSFLSWLIPYIPKQAAYVKSGG